MLKAVKGTYDILPDKIKFIATVEQKCRALFELYRFLEIKTPIFEYTDLFTRSIGEATDIVEKEMYTFADSRERNISLRPEGTAPIVRAFLEHKLYAASATAKYFYVGPMFRHEKPQSGRYRQFHQIGVEFLGEDSPFADVEIISLLAHLFADLKLEDIKIKLSSVGCVDCRKEYIAGLKLAMEKKLDRLCENCNSRFHKNPLRVFDCKQDTCKEIIADLPLILNNLCEACASHFQVVKTSLQQRNVLFVEDPYLVRGLDYYTKTVFEVTHHSLGAQDAVAAGGRYNGLVKQMGGPDTPAIGFALGVERLIMCLQASGVVFEKEPSAYLYLIALGEKAKFMQMQLLDLLRKNGLKAEMSYADKSMKAQMRGANKAAANYVLILGENEINNDEIIVKNMDNSEEMKIAQKDVLAWATQECKRRS